MVGSSGFADVPDGEPGVWQETGLGSVRSVWWGVCLMLERFILCAKRTGLCS